jgi:hypothetical protein
MGKCHFSLVQMDLMADIFDSIFFKNSLFNPFSHQKGSICFLLPSDPFGFVFQWIKSQNFSCQFHQAFLQRRKRKRMQKFVGMWFTSFIAVKFFITHSITLRIKDEWFIDGWIRVWYVNLHSWTFPKNYC